ncbi:hypothetical protein [Alcaligenes phenolicus]|uniref:hypothetical protein n=1 Tax=Alcaligenes phenolicus TaxID=232846 RepID=UPI002AA89F32|nr:hypothetical protein [Alcaligenes phenolicus]
MSFETEGMYPSVWSCIPTCTESGHFRVAIAGNNFFPQAACVMSSGDFRLRDFPVFYPKTATFQGRKTAVLRFPSQGAIATMTAPIHFVQFLARPVSTTSSVQTSSPGLGKALVLGQALVGYGVSVFVSGCCAIQRRTFAVGINTEECNE